MGVGGNGGEVPKLADWFMDSFAMGVLVAGYAEQVRVLDGHGIIRLGR